MENFKVKNAKELREYCMPESGGFIFDDSLFPNPVFDDKKNNIEKKMEGKINDN
jgi:hypothetical protein